MEASQPKATEQYEPLALMVEHCLDSPSAHRLFAILTAVTRLGLRVKLEFIDLEGALDQESSRSVPEA